jgi:hypothetical protein
LDATSIITLSTIMIETLMPVARASKFEPLPLVLPICALMAG